MIAGVSSIVHRSNTRSRTSRTSSPGSSKQTVAEQQKSACCMRNGATSTQPERLAELNRRFLSLAPIATKQLQQTHRGDTAARHAGPAGRARRPRPRRRRRRSRRWALIAAGQRAAGRGARRHARRRPRSINALFAQTAAARPDRHRPPDRASSRGRALMLSLQRHDENPCRPRHFKPPPCAPVVDRRPRRRR